MTLSAGGRLGSYELLAPLGAGGMGEVWRARDTRLDRDVAVKSLSAEFSRDPSRLSRFEAEARAASALNHPNIVTIHEFGCSDEGPFLVMELVEGKTLREMLYAGAFAPRKALQIAVQLSDALAGAHEAGIVHRDLKPENVMVTREGLAKILDFGLAKFSRAESGDDDERGSPTLTEENGQRLEGTSGYMSPEQASGQAVDFRSDQFALGAVVYEMLTGRRAFHRSTRVETLAAVIREDPEPLAAVEPRTPAPLRWIVERCLGKAPEDRYASTRDLARDLQSVREHFSQIEGSSESARLLDPNPPRSRLRWSSIVGAAVAVLVAAAYFLGSNASARGSPSFQRLTFRDGTVWSARFGSDGHTVAYSAAWNGGPIQIYTTRPEAPESSPLAVPASSLLAVSPSGEIAIALSARPSGSFSTVGMLARTTLAGGAPREVLDGVQAADFSPDGASLAVLRAVEGRSRLEFPIGRRLYEAAAGYLSDPRVSPRGNWVAFLEHPMRGSDAGSVAVIGLDGNKRTLSSGWVSVRGLAWSPDGNEVWFTAASVGGSRALHAVTLTGRRRLVIRVPGALTLQDVTREGRALLSHEHAREGIEGVSPGDGRKRELSWHDWSRPVDLSADGTAVLFDETGEGGGGTYSVYVRPTDQSPAVRLGDGHALALSPDARFALSTPQAAPARLVLLPTGPGPARAIATGRFDAVLRAAWIPGDSSNRLMLAANEPNRGLRLYVQPASGGEPRAVTGEGVGSEWAISPDGARVAALDPNGQLQTYSIDGGGDPIPVSGALRGDSPVRFSPDGRSLYVATRGEDASCELDRLDLTSGRRELWKTIAPPESAGVFGISRVLLSADGESYVYTYVQLLDELYLVDGLR